MGAAAAVAPGLVLAQVAAADAPENSTSREYGRGWTCNVGYREAADRCQRIVVPANAHLAGNSYGRGWECDRSYRLTEEMCLASADACVPRRLGRRLEM